MIDYQNYINALRKCAREHDNDTTYTGHIIVSDLCRDTANLLESLEPKPKTGHWTIKQYQVPIENKQVPTVSGITFPTEPTACKIICTFTHSDCKSEEYLNKYNYCPNCGCRMIDP